MVAVRQHQPECVDRGEADGLLALRPVRLYPHARGVCGRAGAVRAGALRRRGTYQNSRWLE